MSKLKNFKEWSLNESKFMELETGIDLKAAAKIDIAFAENYRELFDWLVEMNRYCDDFIGELVMMTAEGIRYYEHNKYGLLSMIYGSLINDSTGEIRHLHHDEGDNPYWQKEKKRFEEQNKVVPLEDAKQRIDDFLAQDVRKCRTMVYLFELCHHRNLKGSETINLREYAKPENWNSVIDFIKKSQDNFPEIFDMVPSWFNVEEILHLLPLAPNYQQKFRARMIGRKFGI